MTSSKASKASNSLAKLAWAGPSCCGSPCVKRRRSDGLGSVERQKPSGLQDAEAVAVTVLISVQCCMRWQLLISIEGMQR